MLGMFKNKLAGSVNKFSGKKDFLEAVCAACALVAAAEGDVSDDEAEAAVKAIVSNAALSAAFPGREIEMTADAMFKRAVGRAGKLGLYREIEDVVGKGTPEDQKDVAEAILCSALDVADSDGSIGDQEKAALEKIAQKLGLKLADYL